MKCAQCEKDGLKSQINVGATFCRPLGGTRRWYDEEGNYHSHDLDINTTSYRCSNGHQWSETHPRICSCGKEGRH